MEAIQQFFTPLSTWLKPRLGFNSMGFTTALLLYFGEAYFAPAAILAFLGLGILAERKRYM